MTAPAVLGTDRLELGEGIRWTDGRAVLTDILTGRLLELPDGPDAPLAPITRLPCPLGAVAPVEGTRPLDRGGGPRHLPHRPRGPRRLDRAPGEDAPVPMRMNDGVADPHGRFWAGSMAYEATPDAGSLYRLDRDGRVTQVLRDVTIPNGPAFSADGTVMYLADSARGVIRRYPVDPASGDPGTPEPFVTLGSGSPDGMTTDIEGCLWTAVWGTGQVHRYRPDRGLDRIVDLPAGQPRDSASAAPTAERSSSPARTSACPSRTPRRRRLRDPGRCSRRPGRPYRPAVPSAQLRLTAPALSGSPP
ncbi:SMP-30/gluconolactonase/LRE family protein [Streptomyces mirabilis]|nr:SMP-30/gluconolactonase/LRE family protein [Streptomyces mirabilis]